MLANPATKTKQTTPDPSELRMVFGANLRLLCERYQSVSEVSRALGINRTQFNRYLSGESFPRPDVLYKICAFFDVDARILLEPVGLTTDHPADLLNHPFLQGFFGETSSNVPETLFPSGFYRFCRQSFLDIENFVLGLIWIKRQDGYTFLRGFEPRSALRAKGLSTNTYTAEFRGIVLRQEDGVMAVVTHRGAMACSFNFLAPNTAFQSNIWEGYATRTVRENVAGKRAMRMVYEHLGESLESVLPVARQTGVVPSEKVPAYYLHLLRPGDEFR